MHHPRSASQGANVATIALFLLATLALAHGDHDHDHDHAHADPTAHPHGTTEAPAGMTVSLDVRPDPMSGYNVHIVTTGFTWAPERASLAHIAGEGHAHLYVDGEKVARVYGPWHHLERLPAGDAEVRVTLNTNTHDDYAHDGVVVADSVTVASRDAAAGGHESHADTPGDHESAGAHVGDEHDHGPEHEHEHEHEHDADRAGPIGANVVTAGGVEVRIEPVLANDGRLVFAVSALDGGEPAPTSLSGTVRTPDGARVAFEGASGAALAPLASASPGRYRIEGLAGAAAFVADVEALVGTTDLGTDVVAFLAPAPGPATERAELFAYGLADGTAVHTRYAAGVAPAAADGAQPSPAAELTHTHFDHVDGLPFAPAGNQVGLAFPGPGPWDLTLELGGAVRETAGFAVGGE